MDVKKNTLKDCGAVSEKTAKEMAKTEPLSPARMSVYPSQGLRDRMEAARKKPVGLVYMACCLNNRTTVKEFHLKGDRNKVREYSVVNALTLLRECILEEGKEKEQK